MRIARQTGDYSDQRIYGIGSNCPISLSYANPSGNKSFCSFSFTLTPQHCHTFRGLQANSKAFLSVVLWFELEKKTNPCADIWRECQFIERFLAVHDKILYKNTFQIFIDELQKAIQKKRDHKKVSCG